MSAVPKTEKGSLGLARSTPVNIELTCSATCWRRVGKLVAFEIESREWTLTHTMEKAVHPVSGVKMGYATLMRLIDGEYSRGGPYIATLQRVFLGAFADSGYRLILTNGNSRLEKG